MAATKVKKPEICTYCGRRSLAVRADQRGGAGRARQALRAQEGVGQARRDICEPPGGRGDRRQAPRGSRSSALGLLYTEKVENSAQGDRRVAARCSRSTRTTAARRTRSRSSTSAEGAGTRSRSSTPRSNKIDEYIRVLEREVETGTRRTGSSLAMKIAVLYRDALQKADRAMRAFEKVLPLDENNLAAAEALIPLYEKANAIEGARARARDPARARDRRSGRAPGRACSGSRSTDEEQLRDKGAAFGWWLQGARRGPRGRARSAQRDSSGSPARPAAGTELVDAYAASLPKFEPPRPMRCRCMLVDGAASSRRSRATSIARSTMNRQILEHRRRQRAGARRARAALPRQGAVRGSARRSTTKKLELAKTTATSGSRSTSRSASSTRTRSRTTTKAVAAYLAILDAAGDEPHRAARARSHLPAQPAVEGAGGRSSVASSRSIGPDDDKAAHVELKYRLGQSRSSTSTTPRARSTSYRDILDIEPSHAGRAHRARGPPARRREHAEARPSRASSSRSTSSSASGRALVGVHEIQLAPREGRAAQARRCCSASASCSAQAARRREGVRRVRARVHGDPSTRGARRISSRTSPASSRTAGRRW